MIEKAEPHTLIEGKPTNPPLSSKRKADREDGIFLKKYFRDSFKGFLIIIIIMLRLFFID